MHTTCRKGIKIYIEIRNTNSGKLLFLEYVKSYTLRRGTQGDSNVSIIFV